MARICIYETGDASFAGNGLGLLAPTSCLVTEVAGGAYELTLEHPVTDDGKWTHLKEDRVIRAPVPALTTPELSIAHAGTPAVVGYVYRFNGQVKCNVRRGPKAPGTRVDYLYKGEECVAETQELTNGFLQATTPRGITGWIEPQWLTYDRTITGEGGTDAWSEVVPSRAVKDQLFRIYQVVKSSDGTSVQAKARHICYDMTYNCVLGYKTESDTAADAVVAGIFTHLADQGTDFACFCSVAATLPATDYSARNPIACLLDEQTGVVAKTRSRLVRDNYALYVVPSAQTWRGVTVRYGRDLKGVEVDTDESGVYTVILPIGADANGDPVYLPEWSVASSRVNSYPFMRVYPLKVSSAKVGAKDEAGNAKDLEAVYAELRQAAQDKLNEGIDLPKLTMTVDFVDLGATDEGAAFAGLQKIVLYDTVRVVAAWRGVDAMATVTGYEYDALMGRYNKLTLGDAYASKLTPVTGSQLVPGTVMGDVLANGSVLPVALALGSVTAPKLAEDAVTRDAMADWAVELADIGLTDESTGKVASAFLGELMQGRLHLRNLTVDEANIVNLTVGQLLLRDANGKLCKLTAETDPETGETVIVLKEAPVVGGQDIEPGSVTAGCINVSELAASEGFVGHLLAEDGTFLRSIKTSTAFVDAIAPQVGDSLQIYSKLRDAQDAADEAKSLADKYARVMEISDGVHIKTTDAEDHAELHLDAGQIVMRDTQGQAAMTVGADATRVRTLHAEQAVRLGGLTLRKLESGAVVLGKA